MFKESTYAIKFTINGELEENKLVLKLEPNKGLLKTNTNIYIPVVTINGFKTDEFNEICEGTVNTKFVIEEISEIYKKNLKHRYRVEKKNFRLIDETIS